jgi:hypothetical protein
MPKFKNNHTIPKCLIKQWAVQGPDYLGTYVYEYKPEKSHFSAGKGSGSYSFAIETDIYVPKNEEERIDKIERWLGGIENTLSIFLRELKKNHNSVLLKDRKSFDLLLLALFSLRHRSKYNLQSIQNFFKE